MGIQIGVNQDKTKSIINTDDGTLLVAVCVMRFDPGTGITVFEFQPLFTATEEDEIQAMSLMAETLIETAKERINANNTV